MGGGVKPFPLHVHTTLCLFHVVSMMCLQLNMTYHMRSAVKFSTCGAMLVHKKFQVSGFQVKEILPVLDSSSHFRKHQILLSPVVKLSDFSDLLLVVTVEAHSRCSFVVVFCCMWHFSHWFHSILLSLTTNSEESLWYLFEQ